MRVQILQGTLRAINSEARVSGLYPGNQWFEFIIAHFFVFLEVKKEDKSSYIV